MNKKKTKTLCNVQQQMCVSEGNSCFKHTQELSHICFYRKKNKSLSLEVNGRNLNLFQRTKFHPEGHRIFNQIDRAK